MTTLTELAAAPWKAPEPRELPEWRARMCDYITSDESIQSLAQATNTGNTAMFPTVPGMDGSPDAVAYSLLARAEERRLREAHLYYATADMTSLALAAASTPPAEPVKETRLPSPYGLMVFAEPIGGHTQDLAEVLADSPMTLEGAHTTVTTPIVAVSWGVWAPDDAGLSGDPAVRWFNLRTHGTVEPIPHNFDGVWLTFYSQPGSAFEALAPDTVIATAPDGTAITAGVIQAHPHRTPLTWENETALAFGVPFGELEPDPTKEWAQVVYTAWQLMSQTGKTQLTEVEEIPRDRAGRKRDRRDGITGPSGVRLVNVHTAHRPSQDAAEQDALASTGRRAPQWSCRWPVRPYRRNTCLNPRAHGDSGCEHEDRIVPAHIKGPSDRPLKVGQTVNLWDHQPQGS
ncbi:hypothetical protein [Streptomyces sp. NRRL F-5727]|uniref:hypothetical protein n=1 Tax=Streptomyces sp. NRRL F-5727 TaxID=1463871 RepID=UPI0004CAB0AD|nr:hypothetical protein [Streptomyces sp. NRRL F-5727]